ncbi:MAG: hypothetical protein MI807_06255 [Verrucomicrobiales bacterium]|nr:hypothetical protein [Verrucomicrobiales bacterium]
MLFRYSIVGGFALVLASCQTAGNKPYAPPSRPAAVESVEIMVRDFHGRPEAFAKVKGTLSTSAAQLVDSKQSREGNVLYLEVLEQTPRGAALVAGITESPEFERTIPLELLGLLPGTYIVNTNGIEAEMEVPSMRATAFSGEIPTSQQRPAYRIVDEFIPIEESGLVSEEPGM